MEDDPDGVTAQTKAWEDYMNTLYNLGYVDGLNDARTDTISLEITVNDAYGQGYWAGVRNL